jgi:cell division protein FtsB
MSVDFKQLVRRAKTQLNLNNGILVVALMVAFSWVWSTIGAISRNFKLQQQVDDLKQQIAVQELKNKTAELQNKYYASDEFLELSAREHLNKAAPDEKQLILPPNTASSKDGPPQVKAETPITERSNFDQWMYFLFGGKK